jgi:uncharacterized protein with GYD domain
METYIIFTRLSPGSFKDGEQFRQLAKRVSQRIKDECPKARWKDSYALMGRFDVVDIVEAQSAADAERAALIIRAEANATTETMHATPWNEFLAKL